MAFAYTATFNPLAPVNDCMVELSSIKFTPPHMKLFEQELFKQADVVFTDGNSFYEANNANQHNMYSFPSSNDQIYFKAVGVEKEFADQSVMPNPSLGIYGVKDERIDIEIIK